jgi:hypothetical protein
MLDKPVDQRFHLVRWRAFVQKFVKLERDRGVIAEVA